MTLILRGVTGVLIGLLYGLFIGAVYYPLTHIGLDYEHPGGLIPNTVEWAWINTVLSAIVAGAFGEAVGLIVGLVGTKRKTSAIIGFVGGLILLAILFMPLPKQLVASSLRYILGLLLEVFLFPIGLALVGVLVSSVGIHLKRWTI